MNSYQIRKLLSFIIRFNFIYLRIPNTDPKITPLENVGIPKIVFQTIKNRWVPWKLYLEVMKFRKANPEYVFVVFSNREMRKFMEKNYSNSIILQAFLKSRFGVMRSDIFKYCYAFKNGGISLDLTKYLSKPLSYYFDRTEFHYILSQENQLNSYSKINNLKFGALGLKPKLLINWCFASLPNGQRIKDVIKEIEVNYTKMKGRKFEDVKEKIWESTGPIAFNNGFLKPSKRLNDERLLVIGEDFEETTWPKFQSADLTNVISKHYTQLRDKQLFRN